jgi:hypothetical protein
MPLLLPRENLHYRCRGLSKRDDITLEAPVVYPARQGMPLESVKYSLQYLTLDNYLVFPEWAGSLRAGAVSTKIKWAHLNGSKVKLSIAWPEANFMPHVWIKKMR